MSPRASFVIPAYNAERWISKAIYSCRNQTIKKIEIIVVNDGSTDGTQEITEWHAKEDPRVLLFNQANKGRSAARNFGNDQAQSPIIMVLDADDMATRDRTQHTIAAFELKKPDFLYGSFFVVDAFGNVGNKVGCQAFDPVLCKKKKQNFICHSTVAYTKKLASDIRYEEGEFSRLGLDDWKFQWDAHKKGYSLRHIRTPLVYYRMTEDGISATRKQEEVDKTKEEYLANA